MSKQKNESCDQPYSDTAINEGSLQYETVDSRTKLNSLLTDKDKAALVNILQENQHLLEETEELFYENEQDVILKIPFHILKNVMEVEDNKSERIDLDNLNNDEVIVTVNTTEDDETTVEKLNEEEEEEEGGGGGDTENSTILKSLGNGVFLDPTSNKRLKLDSFIKKSRSKEKKQNSSDGSNQYESRRKDGDKNNTMLVKEYLNEFDEKVYVLELIKEEETIVQKREKILSQLQTILMMVNSEDDVEVLDDIQSHLSKYAVPE